MYLVIEKSELWGNYKESLFPNHCLPSCTVDYSILSFKEILVRLYIFMVTSSIKSCHFLNLNSSFSCFKLISLSFI